VGEVFVGRADRDLAAPPQVLGLTEHLLDAHYSDLLNDLSHRDAGDLRSGCGTVAFVPERSAHLLVSHAVDLHELVHTLDGSGCKRHEAGAVKSALFLDDSEGLRDAHGKERALMLGHGVHDTSNHDVARKVSGAFSVGAGDTSTSDSEDALDSDSNERVACESVSLVDEQVSGTEALDVIDRLNEEWAAGDRCLA